MKQQYSRAGSHLDTTVTDVPGQVETANIQPSPTAKTLINGEETTVEGLDGTQTISIGETTIEWPDGQEIIVATPTLSPSEDATIQATPPLDASPASFQRLQRIRFQIYRLQRLLSIPVIV